MPQADDTSIQSDAALQADLAALRRILAKPLTKESLSQFASASSISRLVGSFAFGSIRWPRTSERLLTPKRADAFEVTLHHTQTVLEYQPDGVHFVTIIVPDYPPSKSDGPDDDEYARVSFVASGLRADIDYTVGVRFTPLAKWAHTIVEGMSHTIEPASRVFNLKDGAVIPPFDVKSAPFSLPKVPFGP